MLRLEKLSLQILTEFERGPLLPLFRFDYVRATSEDNDAMIPINVGDKE